MAVNQVMTQFVHQRIGAPTHRELHFPACDLLGSSGDPHGVAFLVSAVFLNRALKRVHQREHTTPRVPSLLDFTPNRGAKEASWPLGTFWVCGPYPVLVLTPPQT